MRWLGKLHGSSFRRTNVYILQAESFGSPRTIYPASTCELRQLFEDSWLLQTGDTLKGHLSACNKHGVAWLRKTSIA